MSSQFNLYPMGSTWRKWDLQVQPVKNEWLGNVEGHNEQIRLASADFMDKALANGLDVVGITDHNTGIAIDHAINEGFIDVVPGVELDTPEGWHLLVLFNQDYKDRHQLSTWKEAVDYFLGIACQIQRPFFTEQNVAKKIACTTIDLLKTITDENIGVPVFAHCYSNDGFFKQGDVSGRKDIINLFIDGTAKFAFEIKDNYDHLDQIRDKVKGWYDGKDIDIPILSSSDAHKATDVGSTFSWIKADPTFEGLKQILYEPSERIRIQESKPDEKKVYDVIQKVKFQDTSFTTKEIPLSENLTTIIGGKSTGKSILLKNVARCVDEGEYKRRNDSIGAVDRKPVKGFEVYWKDGQVSKLDGGEKNPNKRIIYIPQSYLNRVVDEEQKTTDIDKIIRDVLLQEEDFNEWHKELLVREKVIANKIEDRIRDLYDNIENYTAADQEIKKRGDQDGLKKQIIKLKQEISEEQKTVELTDEEIKLYDEKTLIIKTNRVRIQSIEKDILALENSIPLYITFPDIGQFSLKKTIENVELLASEKSTEYQADWKNGIDKLIKSLNDEKNECLNKINQAELDISGVKEKVEKEKVLKTKFAELDIEEKKENEIRSWEEERKRHHEGAKKCIHDLAVLNSQYYSIYLEAKDHVSLDGLDEELDFSIDTDFSEENFKESFVDRFFDGRKLRSGDYDRLAKYRFDSKQKHEEAFESFIWQILQGKAPLNKNVKRREVVTALCQNWFLHDFKVEFQGDQLIDMSPGKKSFVLLRLLIDLDNSECPILIDQPEDDLDNRSIYRDIVFFLRRRKRQRQIIIVTHNPNLVLGADSELVIVANQDGEDTKNSSFKFEYVSGAIEHSVLEDDAIDPVLLKRGTQEHVCGILEGGEEAFNKRRNKYRFSR